jgi:hypothetical protein
VVDLTLQTVPLLEPGTRSNHTCYKGIELEESILPAVHWSVSPPLRTGGTKADLVPHDGLIEERRSGPTVLVPLMELYAGFRKAVADKDLLDFVPMIALQNYRIVLGRAPASAVSLQFSGKIGEVDTFPVNALDDGCRFAPLAHFHAHLYGLLLHADGAANA